MNPDRNRCFLATSVVLALVAFSPVVLAQGPAKPPGPAPAPTSGDGKAFETINGLAEQGKWVDCMKAAEKFMEQYKDLSPYSRNVRYILGLSYLHQEKPMADESVRELRKLLPDAKVLPEIKERASLLIAKAFTIKGAGLPAGTGAQNKLRNDTFEEAIKAYDAYLAGFPTSRSNDTALFLSGTLCIEVKRYEDAVKRFATLAQKFPNSPLKNDAVLNVGKTFLIQAGDLMTALPGKEPTPENIQKALAIYEANALPALTAVYQSGDLALQNEAQFYIGQIRLTQSQRSLETDEEKKTKEQTARLNAALEAFRAVRSIEEVKAAEEAKIQFYNESINRLTPGTPEYAPSKNYYENLISVEAEKLDKLKNGTDQYVAARIAIARIFLFLKKNDECRVLIRYLQGQPELLAKDPEAQAAIAALLCHTYLGQDNLEKSVETYDAFRGAFKGNEAGEDLPLFTANLVVEKGQSAKAEEIVNQGMEDFKAANNGAGWQFATDAVRILIKVALDKGDYEKAQTLCDKVLSSVPKPDVEVETLLIKGAVLEGMAVSKGAPAQRDEAIRIFQTIRDKFPTNPKAEDAWFRQCQIYAGMENSTARAIDEMTKFNAAFEGGKGKSEKAKTNVAINLYQLGKVQDQAGKPDDAIKTFRKVLDTYADEEATPDAYFRIFDIETKRKDFAAAKKAMEQYLEKYPMHKNVYFAYSNIAEILYSGALTPKVGKDGKPLPPGAVFADLDAGTKKLYEYVDYEKAKDIKPQRGQDALVKIVDRWVKQLSTYGNFALLGKDQKNAWQHSVDEVTRAVDKSVKEYPEGERLGEILEKAVAVQKERVKAQQTDAAGGLAYFEKLITDYGTANITKAKLHASEASFLQDYDAKKAATIREMAFTEMGAVPKPAAPTAGPNPTSAPTIPRFQPSDWDQRLSDSFEGQKYPEMTKMIERIRAEYPLDAPGLSPMAQRLTEDANAVALFWEGKVLETKNDVTGAGKKFEELRAKFPRSAKLMEADYGIINGKLTAGTLKADADRVASVKRLTEIISYTNTKKFDLQAKSLFLVGQIYEDAGDYEAAIAAYAKVAARFASVPKVAGDGLWKAANLAERQFKKEIPVKTKAERKALADKAAAIADAKKAEEKAAAAKAAADAPKDGKDAKPGDKKPDAKPGEKAPAPKPGDKNTAAADPKK